jgi:hypothetical protein
MGRTCNMHELNYTDTYPQIYYLQATELLLTDFDLQATSK